MKLPILNTYRSGDELYIEDDTEKEFNIKTICLQLLSKGSKITRNDVNHAKEIKNRCNSYPELLRIVCEMIGAARVDGMDSKSNVWRTLMNDGDAVTKGKSI